MKLYDIDTYISMHVIFLAAAGFGVEDVNELGEVLEVLSHLRGEDHIDDIVPHLLVCFTVEILEYVYAIIVWKEY